MQKYTIIFFYTYGQSNEYSSFVTFSGEAYTWNDFLKLTQMECSLRLRNITNMKIASWKITIE